MYRSGIVLANVQERHRIVVCKGACLSSYCLETGSSWLIDGGIMILLNARGHAYHVQYNGKCDIFDVSARDCFG